MTQQPSSPAPPAPPRSGLDGMFDWFRGLGMPRDTDNRWFGGVCSGLARRFGIDPILVRALAVVLALVGGVGLTLYVLAWLLLPDRDGRILAEAAIREGDAGGIVLVVVFVLLLATGVSTANRGPGWFAWWLVPLAVIGFIIIRSSDRRSVAPLPTGGTTVPPTPYAAPPAPMPFGTTPTGATPAGTVGADPTAAPGPQPGPTPPPMAAAYPQAPGATAARYGSPPPWTPRPVAPVAPPAPAPRRRSAGGSAALVALGLVIAGFGLGHLLDGPTGFPGSPELLGSALALAAVSLLVLVLGIMGRRGGFAALLAIVLGFTTWIATISPLTIGTGSSIGDQTWRPVTTVGQQSYSTGLGDAVLDLSNYAVSSAAATGTPELTVNVGLGDLTIIVPSGVQARVTYDLGLGSVRIVNADGSTQGTPSSGGISSSTTVGSGRTVDVTAHVGLGDLRIEQR